MLDLETPAAYGTPADIRAHARFDQLGALASAEDDLIETYLAAAVAVLEEATSKRFISRRVQFEVDRAFAAWWFPAAPIVSIEAVRGFDPDGAEIVIEPANFHLASGGICPKLVTASGFTWPDLHEHLPIEIEAVAGFGANALEVDAVDPRIRQLVRWLATHFTYNRHAITEVSEAIAVMPLSLKQLVSQVRKVPGRLPVAA